MAGGRSGDAVGASSSNLSSTSPSRSAPASSKGGVESRVDRQSSAGRQLCADLVRFLLEDACEGRPEFWPRPLLRSPSNAGWIYNFCSCARATAPVSIMAESILRKESAGRFRAFSARLAGRRGAVDPLTLKVLRRARHADRGAAVEELERVRRSPARPSSTSSSPSATPPPARPVRSGRASR